MKRVSSYILALIMVATSFSFAACDQIADILNPSFSIYTEAVKSDIFVDAADHKQVIRAAGDLQQDILAVTEGSGVRVTSDAASLKKSAIIIGTMGQSALVDQIIASGRFNEARSIEGKWESYAIKVVSNPIAGLEQALVIAGSDKRGTIYGIYTISEEIGVSPWYYFGDVVPVKRAELTLNNYMVVSKEPSVKYRGIFLNDEFNFTTWAKSFADGKGSPNAEVYGRVFELLLRLKSNTLWPGMHGVSTGFYVSKDENGVSYNAKTADDYGVVIGTSHCEQAMRNNIAEWYPWVTANSGRYGLPNTTNATHDAQTLMYDFSRYPQAVTQYWRESLEATKNFENLITIGMRGIHDERFMYAGLSNTSFENRVDLLQRVLDEQMKLIVEIYGEDYHKKTQLVYIPYKEAADYYYGTENGVSYNKKITLPDHTLLMWAEDNYGYLRQTPDPDTLVNEDGYNNTGIYYHISYVGVPCVYIWQDTTAFGTIYGEMKRAYDTGASGYWIVNVGDIKPGEYGMEYFLHLAYDIEEYDDTEYQSFMTSRALRDFTANSEIAQEIASLYVDFKFVAETYKPDFIGKDNMPELSHITDGDEAMRLLNQFEVLERRASAVYNALPNEKKDAFYQLIYYSIRGTLYNCRRIVYAQKSQLSFYQGRVWAARNYAEAAERAHKDLYDDVDYYNSVLSGGKWYGMMNPHIGGSYYGIITEKELSAMIVKVNESTTNGVGAVAEGQTIYTEGEGLSFSSYNNETRFIDVFSLGNTEQDYTVTMPEFVVMEYSGRVGAEERLLVSIDWSKTQEGENTGDIIISDDFGNSYTFTVQANKQSFKLIGRAYVLSGGAVSIEAEHYSALVAGEDGTYWQEVQGFGRSGSSMKVFPDTMIETTSDYTKTAKIIYTVYSEAAGAYLGTLYRVPTLNENGTTNIAIGLEDKAPQLLTGTNRTNSGNWSVNVMQRIEKLSFTLQLQKGYNNVVVYRSDPFISFDKVVLSKDADNSYYGKNESYNTFNYQSKGVSPLADLGFDSDKLYAPDRYWFNFGGTNVFGVQYTQVFAQNRVYNEGKGFGFATKAQSDSLTQYYRSSITAAERNKSFVTGSEAAEFKVKLPNGKYSVGIISGDIDPNGLSFNMSLSVNGVDCLTNKAIAKGNVYETYAEVTVTDGMMSFNLSGTWALNAIEIYTFGETTSSGSAQFIVSRKGGYIEAESALEQTSYANSSVGTSGGKEWMPTGGVSGYALVAGPENRGNNSATNPPTGARLNYQIYFEEAGTYYFWVLAKFSSADDDSFHFGWDGSYVSTYNPGKNQNEFIWTYTGIIVTVNAPGTHTLTIWQREDGTVIDKIFFNPTYSYNSFGESYSARMPQTDGAVFRK